MNTAYKTLLAGMLAIVFAGPALAHGGGSVSASYYNGYQASGLNGGITVWGNSHGQAGWSGAITYGAPVYYAPAYGPPPVQAYGPRYYHGPGRGHAKAYRKGYRHGRHDARHHGHRKGRHH